MKYVNQLLHPDIPYPTHMADKTKTAEEKISNIARSGCGLCCASMMVDYLTGEELSLTDAVKMSALSAANRSRGTNMQYLAPMLAESFGLDYKFSADLDEAIEALRGGAFIIAHVRIDPETGLSLFTNSGHYISLVSTDGKEFCILDPSYKPEKYEREDRKEKVDTSHAPYLYCKVEDTHEATVKEKGKPKYYIFQRKR